MTSWICLDCGSECSPSEEACPECAGPLELVRTPAPAPGPPPECVENQATQPPLQPPHAAAPPRPKSPALILPPAASKPPDFVMAGPVVVPCVPMALRQRDPETVPEPDPLPRLTRARLASPSNQRPPEGLPKWAIRAVVLAVVVLAIASSVQKVIDTSGNNAPSVPIPLRARSVRVRLPEPNPQPPDGQIEHPFARLVEVTSLRVVRVNGHPQVQYVVENQAPQDVTDLGIHVAVRTATLNAGTKPLFSLDARVPRLAAHEAKEIRTDLDSTIDVSQAFDPRNLQVGLRVTLQQ